MARILIIDDDQDITDNLSMILESTGHEVAIKGDTSHLLDEVRAFHPDLIILDIMMPEDSQAGFKAARLLNQDAEVGRIPVLILSAVNQRSNLSFGFSESDISSDFMPVEAFIEKPVEPRVLIQKIDQLLFRS
ncbi:MAG: response regulator [Magnetococcales bacterium]|nr:response regulator [Magnetococcales bacterium]